MAEYVVGIDLGGTNMQVGVLRRDGEIVGRAHTMTRAEGGPDEVIVRMVGQVREVCDEVGVPLRELGAVGIGAPGAIDATSQVVTNAPNLGWKRVPLGERLGSSLGGVPVVLDNDVNAAVLGENRRGAGDNAPHALGVWVGTGVGGGLVLNGKVYRGGLGTAGEIGHTVIFPDAPPDDSHMEYHCSRKRVTPKILALLDQGQASVLLEPYRRDPDAVTLQMMAEAYAAGDDLVGEVIDRAADLLGLTIGNVVTLLSMPLILLGGGLTEAMGEKYVRRVESATRANVFPPAIAEKVEVRGTQLGPDAGLIGAGMLAWDRVDGG
ncbi:MAG: ROK family protein [Planctomycetota bacterium]